MVQAVTYSVV